MKMYWGRFLACGLVAVASVAGVSAVEIDFNDGWEWRYGGEKEWRAVDLPHDFMIESPWDESANHTQRVFKPLGEAFYRKSFAYDPAWEGKRVLLDFGGIMFFGDVKVNGPGRLVALDDGDHYTDLLFAVDTKKMKEGYLLAIIRRMGEGEIVLAATDAKTGASVSCKLWPASADR